MSSPTKPFRSSFPNRLFLDLKRYRDDQGLTNEVDIEDDGWECHVDFVSEVDQVQFALRWRCS